MSVGTTFSVYYDVYDLLFTNVLFHYLIRLSLIQRVPRGHIWSSFFSFFLRTFIARNSDLL